MAKEPEPTPDEFSGDARLRLVRREGRAPVTDAHVVYRRQIVYAALMGMAALLVGGLTLVYGKWPAWYQLLGFSLAACLLGTRTIRLSRTLGTVSVGFIFVFAAIVELSPVAGVIAGASSAIGGTLMCSLICAGKPRPQPVVVLTAISNIVLAAAAAGWAYQTLFHTYDLLGISTGVLPAFIVIGVYYAVNSMCVALMASTDGARSPFAVWSDNLSWTVLPFYVGGAVVMVIHLLARDVGPHVWLLLIPPVAGLHIAMDMRAKARIAERVQDRATETIR